jgi:hypothetical protein
MVIEIIEPSSSAVSSPGGLVIIADRMHRCRSLAVLWDSPITGTEPNNQGTKKAPTRGTRRCFAVTHFT